MREVCYDCKWAKPKTNEYCYCVKYGCPIRYGRAFCVSFDRRESDEKDNRRVVHISRADNS